MICTLVLTAVTLAAPADAVLIRAGDVALDAAAIKVRAAALRASGARLTPEQAVDGMATEVALASEARRTGLASQPATLAKVALERDRALAEIFADSLVPATQALPEAEVRRVFHQGSDALQLAIVVVERKEDALALRRRLEGGADIAAEARSSLDPRTAGKGGDTGLLPRAQFDAAVAEEAFRAQVGSLIGPVQMANGGWAVARVKERVIADEAGLAAARPRIGAFLRKQASAQARSHALEMFRRSSQITVNEKFLASLGGRVEPERGEAETVVATLGDRKLFYRDVLPSLRSLAGVGHGNVTLKRQVIDGLIDELLLAQEARRRKLDATPEARTALLVAEVQGQAQEMARSILGSAAASAPPEKLNALLASKSAEIRKRANVSLDRAGALAAASAD